MPKSPRLCSAWRRVTATLTGVPTDVTVNPSVAVTVSDVPVAALEPVPRAVATHSMTTGVLAETSAGV